MKGDAVRLVRVLAIRLAWAALAVAAYAAALYLSGNFNGLSDRALSLALRVASYAAGASAALSLTGFAAALAGPFLGDRLSPAALAAALGATALGAAILVASALVRAAVGGLSF